MNSSTSISILIDNCVASLSDTMNCVQFAKKIEIGGVIFALAFYPIRYSLFNNKLGWLILWWILVALGILSTFGPAPGSIEAIIYTNLDVSFFTYVEVVMQAFAFAFVLFYWIKNSDLKWLNWLMGIAFTLVMLLPTLGLLIGQ